MLHGVRKQLTINVPQPVLHLAHGFREAGHVLYLVGGAVRDAVLGRPPKDFDLATDARPEQAKRIAEGLGYSVLEVGAAFGVVAVTLPFPTEKVEIATFREDLSAGRHPEVRFAGIEEDVKRRDLTINALFYDIERGEVVDLVGGLRDIGLGLVRTVGDPQDRFAEDPLRIMRAVRFVSRLGYNLDRAAAEAIMGDSLLSSVSKERIHDELVKSIAVAQNVPRLMRLMTQLDLWRRVLPGLKVSADLDALVSSRGIDTNDPSLALTLLLDRYGTADVPNVAQRLRYLKYSTEEVDVVSFLLRFRDVGPDTALALRRHFNRGHVGTDRLANYFLQRGMPDRRSFEAFSRYLGTTPVSGDLLLAQGYSGPALGVELERQERELFCGLLERHG